MAETAMNEIAKRPRRQDKKAVIVALPPTEFCESSTDFSRSPRLGYIVLARARPVAENGLDQCKCRDRGRVRAQNARAERDRNHVRQLCKQGPFLVGKATLGADQDGNGRSSRPHRR